MTYKLPLLEDGTVDLLQIVYELDLRHAGDKEAQLILQALVDHTLERAAKVAREQGCDENECTDIVSEAIRALKGNEKC